MHLSRLTLENVGPFLRAEIAFGNPQEGVPVTLITGVNGSGKSIILDAVRSAFGAGWTTRDQIRDLQRPDGRAPDIKLELEGADQGTTLQAGVNHYLSGHATRARPVLEWVADYWQPALATDGFVIQHLGSVAHENYLRGSLSGRPKNRDLTEAITYFDYLRDSRDLVERSAGEEGWTALQHIVARAVDGGRLSLVRRSTREPVIEHRGLELSLPALSAGSLYVISRMVRLLMRMHSCKMVTQHQMPLLETPGLLLVDEAENHLHPQWQKRFLPDILDLFPRLQIIAATHSPFVVSSAPNALVYRCRDDGGRGCVVENVSNDYENQPVDEILASEAFAETPPYGPKIEQLLQQRRMAIEGGNEAERDRIERVLLDLNPEQFGVFRVTELLRELGEAS